MPENIIGLIAQNLSKKGGLAGSTQQRSTWVQYFRTKTLKVTDLSPRFSFLYWENTENFIKILRISVYKYGEICTPQNRSKWHSQASYDIMKPFLWIKPSIQINRWAIPHKISHLRSDPTENKLNPIQFLIYYNVQLAWNRSVIY